MPYLFLGHRQRKKLTRLLFCAKSANIHEIFVEYSILILRDVTH